ncbi:hypothetical protein HY991_02765 [Candidatus Micrarchaeota archaeon]|nr:hypothetical protein [Candidatus Micrarchaeota archaeon]
MITGGRVIGVGGKTMKIARPEGMEVAINIDSVKAEKGRVTLVYTYNIAYTPNVASISVSGEIHLEEKEADAKRMEESWSKTKQLPQETAEELLTAITYTASAVGTLVAFAINVSAPINVPRARLTPLEGQREAAG